MTFRLKNAMIFSDFVKLCEKRGYRHVVVGGFPWNL